MKIGKVHPFDQSVCTGFEKERRRAGERKELWELDRYKGEVGADWWRRDSLGEGESVSKENTQYQIYWVKLR